MLVGDYFWTEPSYLFPLFPVSSKTVKLKPENTNIKTLLYFRHMQHFCSVGLNISRVNVCLFKHGHLVSNMKLQFQSRSGRSSSCANLNPIFETYLFLSRCKLHFSYRVLFMYNWLILLDETSSVEPVCC